MPLPLLFIAIGAGTAALGLGKTAKAVYDGNDAKKINAAAKAIADTATEEANEAREKCGKAIHQLGMKKIQVLDKDVKRFVDTFEKIHNIEWKDSEGLAELTRFRLDSESFAELKELQSAATSIAAGIGSGAALGAITAFGAYSAAGALATASTGTAIATLSGAAATNATLAFFGGGALTAGGLGMAGGTAVLGGLVAGPALAVMGFVIGAKAKSARNDAYANYAEAKDFSEEMQLVVTLSDGIRKKADMMKRLLLKLDRLFAPMVYSLEEIVNTEGTDFRTYSADQKKAVASSMALAKAIKTVLDTPLLTEDGQLTEESKTISKEITPLLKQYA